MRIAVFASGSGSNFAAIMEAAKAGRLKNIEVALLVCDRPGALVIERAEQESIPVFSFNPKEFTDKQAYEEMILEKLKDFQVDLIVLAGYMRLIGVTLLSSYSGRMINLHPSLLPAFTGKDAVGQALEYGVKVTGITVHFVDAGMDTGPIIAQKTVCVENGETKDSLSLKIQKIEHELLPEVIGWIADGRVELNGRKVEIR